MIERSLGAAGLILLATAFANCTGPEKANIIYQVQASGADNITVDIAYLDAGSDTVRVEDAAVTWQKQFNVETGNPVYLSARSSSPEIVSVTVAIFIDGSLAYVEGETGRNVIATASGIVP